MGAYQFLVALVVLVLGLVMLGTASEIADDLQSAIVQVLVGLGCGVLAASIFMR